MHDQQPSLAELGLQLGRLATALERSESRYRKLERLQRITAAGFLLLAAAAAAGAVAFYSARAAEAQPASPMRPLVQGGDHWVDQILAAPPAGLTGAPEASEWTREKALVMRQAMEQLRKKPDPLHAITVFLGEVQHALQAMPAMREDMDSMRLSMLAMQQDMGAIRTVMGNMDGKMGAVPVMASEMQSMNAKIGVMAGGIDSTLGRTGRNIPFWMPW